MSIFVRRFLSDPGEVVLLNIESVNIIDLNPPSDIIGVGSGTVCIVGEFENGPFNTPTEVFSAQGFVQAFGSLGYTYGGLQAQNPCARQRKADGALVPEFWNGNGFVQLNAKRFSRLVICRADTSVGSVSVQRLAFLTGAASFRYQLVAGQILQLDVGAGPLSATFSATAATVTAVGGAYPTTFAGGNTLTLGYDAAPNFTVTFLAADQTNAQVVARINQYAGFAFADLNAGQLRLTGLQLGSGAQVRVVSGSAGVLTQLGLTSATTFGTGNVANVAAVTPQEIASVVQGAVANTKVEVDQNGALRISNTVAPGFILVGAATTATALGFLVGAEATDSGQPVLVSGAGTYNLGTTGTITIQLDASLPAVTTTVTAGDSAATTVTNLNNAFTAAGQGAPVVADGAVRFAISGPNPGGTITVVAASAPAVLTELGLVVGATKGLTPPFGLLPAGTQVGVSGGVQFVTMQDIDFELAGVTIAGTLQPKASSYSVKIRHALDDGTGVTTGAGTVTVVATPPAIGAFSVVNPQVVSAALTEAALDAQYATALASTTNITNVGQQINVQFSARQSNAIRAALKNTALNASANGCLGRMALVRTPMNTLESSALSTTAQPGVGATRDQRVVYCYPQASTFVPIIALLGVSGGTGFTATGNVDVGADGFLASVLSLLNPEEDPGQATTFTGGVNGLESGANIQQANGGLGFQMSDYQAFKAAGICALRIDTGVAIFQSGVTSVDPLVSPNLTDINRRRMADFIQDSIAISMKQYGKKLSTVKRRSAITTQIRNFMTGLAGGGPGAADGNPNNQDAQRIAGFSLDPKTANTTTSLGKGLFRLILRCRTLSSLKSIVIQTEIGPTVVTVSELTG
jgi:hypothetical protein